MAFQKGYVEINLEVTAAPGCFLTATPGALKVAQGDVASFTIGIQRLEGYAGPIYLQAVNLAGDGHAFTPNPVPYPATSAVLTIDTAGWQPTTAPFSIGIEAQDVPFPE